MARKKVASDESRSTSAPTAVSDLVARFRDHADAYRAGRYNETQIRREFIDPFFKALGWDVSNEQGYAEAYKDVIHEDAIRVGGATKAPDYCFRVGGVRKFFVEAKKPSVDIKGDAGPAFQLRRYAWSAKLPLSILTDFEELAVYDCRVKPVRSDKAGTARVLFFTYEEFLTRWDELASIFTRESILKGSFDKYAESTRRKRGTAEVDDAFLAEIEQWRDVLARNLALRNPDLSQRDLNFAVQRTIDRIVFLRICEDRGIETYGALQGLINAEKIYDRLFALFRLADERYNSGLFHFSRERGRPEEPDDLTPGLTLDDKPLKEILVRLYYPESPYEFSVLPADILGQVYEQFLGQVIRLTKGHRAVVEPKPEVRKAGGVYYTPTYIVDYIVKQTVGRLVEGKTPQQVGGLTDKYQPSKAKGVRPLAVLDPACGSGSFLLGAYQFLLDWYRDRYVESGPKTHAAGRNPRLFQHASGEWRLTTAERKRILLAHIHGVDIDSQAVETTKLSLLLKVLEGETQQTLESQYRLFHERALPDLAANIKCGNSLIGSDFYDDRQQSMFDEEDRLRINAFDWNTEFEQIMKAGGFDAVIGNPPYVRQENLRSIKAYLKRNYSVFDSTADLYVYFIARAIELLRESGYHAYIVSRGFFRAAFGKPLRRFLQNHASVLRIIDFGGLPVFSGAKDTYVAIPVLGKFACDDSVAISSVGSLENQNLDAESSQNFYLIPSGQLSESDWSTERHEFRELLAKVVESTSTLNEIVRSRIFLGVKTGLNEAFTLTSESASQLLGAHPVARPLLRRFLGGQDIRRYHVRPVDQFLIAIPCGWTRSNMNCLSDGPPPDDTAAWRWFSRKFPKIARHLAPYESSARKRQDKGEYWWELRPCDYYDVLQAPKIIYPDIAKFPRFHLDVEGTYIRNTAYCLASDDPYLLALLNSQLMWFAIARISTPFGTRAGEYRYRLFTQYMAQLPIRAIDPTNEHDVAMRNRIVSLVSSMLDFHEQSASARTAHEKTALRRQSEATDRQIDRLVYELYGLTDDEIRIVEQATGSGAPEQDHG